MELDLIDVFSLLYGFSAIILVIFLLSSKTENKLSSSLFSIYLLLTIQDYGAQFTSRYIYNQWPILALTISSTTFLIGPLLYLFVKASVFSDFRLSRLSLLHAIPYILINLFLIPYYYIPLLRNPQLNWGELLTTPLVTNVSYISLHVQITLYYIFIFILLFSYKKILLENYSNPKLDNYKWLITLTTFLFIDLIFATIKNYIRFNVFGNIYEIATTIVSAATLFIIIWLILKALKRPDLFVGVKTESIPVNQLLKNVNNDQALNRTEEESAYAKIIQKLENHMKVNEPFIEPGLSLYDLSKQIDVSQRDLSIAINYVLKKHYFDYINEYRIKKAMEIFKNTNDEKLTVLEVLYEVGFNSKSSFNSAFKKFTGTTPSEYRKKAS